MWKCPWAAGSLCCSCLTSPCLGCANPYSGYTSIETPKNSHPLSFSEILHITSKSLLTSHLGLWLTWQEKYFQTVWEHDCIYLLLNKYISFYFCNNFAFLSIMPARISSHLGSKATNVYNILSQDSNSGNFFFLES